MARPADISQQAWSAIEAAKAAAQAEGAHQLLLRHLFQGCCLSLGDLIGTALVAAGLPESEVQGYLERIRSEVAPDRLGADVPPMEVAPEAAAIINKARELANQHPTDGGRHVAPIHLWAAVCLSISQLEGWLAERGWTREVLQALDGAARQLLPPARSQEEGSPLRPGELQVLKRYCHRHLTQLARQGEITPAYGIDELREKIIRCLLRRDKRSLVLTGPAGVGKTKLVEDLAIRIARGEVPELAHCEVFELDLALFTRGTHLMGERAQRWDQLTGVLRAHPDHIILFVDELHTVVGLPLEGRAMDVANSLKPLLVNDRVRIIGATTPEEHRRYIEGDRALARRFTEIRVPEPDKQTMLKIMKEVAPQYEHHHAVKYSRDTLEAIYDFSRLYVLNQAFPAKALELMDEVGVMKRRGTARQEAKPGVGLDEAAVVSGEDFQVFVKERWGVIPGSLSVDLAGLVKEKVVGQDAAVGRLADLLVRATAGYRRKRGPQALIAFVGPPGVGKSYTAQVLSETLFPGRDTLLTLDMSEFGGRGPQVGEHARFRLVGPPPPYVGWEAGGVLTNHAMLHPVSVVLIDEFEKAHPEARNVLLRIFDDGWIQDGRGRMVSFRGTYFILTANAAREVWDRWRRQLGFVADEDAEPPREAELKNELRREGWSPELLSRIPEVVLFRELTAEDLEEIARRELRRLRDRAAIEDFLLLEYDEAQLARWLVRQCGSEPDCRRLNAVLEKFAETPLAYWRLRRTRGPAALRLAPGEVGLELVEEKGGVERLEQLLFDRVATVFAQRERDERRGRETRLTLGLTNSSEGR